MAGVPVLVFTVAVYYFCVNEGFLPIPKSRDALRMHDMHNLGNALAAYFKNNSIYPAQPGSVDCPGPYNNLSGLAVALVPEYLNTLPKDPNPRSCLYNYWYWSDTHSYAILVNPETADPAVYPDHWCVGTTAGTVPAQHVSAKPCP